MTPCFNPSCVLSATGISSLHPISLLAPQNICNSRKFQTLESFQLPGKCSLRWPWIFSKRRQDLALNGLSLNLTLGSSDTAGSLEAQSHVHECCCPERSSDNVDFPGDDDEVAIISSTEFRLATLDRERSRPARIFPEQAAVLSTTGETPLRDSCETRKPDGCQLSMESGTSNKVDNIPDSSLAQPSSVPEEPILRCPICLNNVKEPVATKCGHIVCKECLTISQQTSKSRCPTCRQKLGEEHFQSLPPYHPIVPVKVTQLAVQTMMSK